MNRHFTPTLLAVGKSEDSFVYGGIFEALKAKGYDPYEILGDGTPALTAAAKHVFPLARRVMCFAHVIRRIDANKKSLAADTQEKVRSDVLLLQYARNEVEFDRSRMFVKRLLLTK